MRRENHLDSLRILATFGVVLLHESATQMLNVSVASMEWQVLNVFDSLVRPAVPIFLMISGRLFLNSQKEVSIRALLTRNIPRLLTAYFFWNIFYACNALLMWKLPVESAISAFFTGHYHLWFIPTLVALYLLTPILKGFVADRKNLRYLLILSVFASIVIPLLESFPLTNGIAVYLSRFPLQYFSGYLAYYLLGYWIASTDFSRWTRIIFYAASGISLLCIILLTSLESARKGMLVETYYSYSSVFVFLYAIGVYLFFKEKNPFGRLCVRHEKMVQKLSGLCFGVYLCHDFFIMLASFLGFNVLNFRPVILAPVLSICIFCTGLGVSFLLSKIPFFGKYMV